MRQGLRLAAVAACAAALAAPARAATIEELPVVPGAIPGTHSPRYLAVGPEAAIWWSESGSEPGIGRIFPGGPRLTRIHDDDVPASLARGAGGTMYWTGDYGVGRVRVDGTLGLGPLETVERPGPSEGLALTLGGVPRWGETDPGGEAVLGFSGGGWGGAVEGPTVPGEGAVSGIATAGSGSPTRRGTSCVSSIPRGWGSKR